MSERTKNDNITRDALLDVLGAAQFYIRAETRLRLRQTAPERVSARDNAYRGLCDAVARCDPDNATSAPEDTPDAS